MSVVVSLDCVKFFMKKFRYYEYDPVIYPSKLWVCVGGCITDIAKIFDDKDGSDKLISKEDVEDSDALTFPAILHESMDYGVVVWLHKLSAVDDSTVTHEAIHAVNFMFSHLGVALDLENDESQAYLGGFIGSCIAKTLKKARQK